MTSRRLARSQPWLLLAALVSWVVRLEAHVQQGQAQGFMTGLMHPISGLDHVLAMVSVGLWGAQLGAPAIWLLPVTFPMVMAFGGSWAWSAWRCRAWRSASRCRRFCSGWRWRASGGPNWRPRPLVAFFAVFHGHAHGTELPAGQSGSMYSIGFVVATGCLHGVGIAIGVVHRWPAGRVALRVAGSVVALAGFGFLWRVVA